MGMLWNDYIAHFSPFSGPKMNQQLSLSRFATVLVASLFQLVLPRPSTDPQSLKLSFQDKGGRGRQHMNTAYLFTASFLLYRAGSSLPLLSLKSFSGVV